MNGVPQLASPAWLLLLLLLPWLAWRHHRRDDGGALTFSRLPARVAGAWRLHLPFYSRLLALGLVAVALARPQLGYAWEETTTEGIDIEVLLDVSGSMGAEDFAPKNRLEVAKRVISDFVAARTGDRIGLVAFAGAAITKPPPTTDRRMLQEMIASLRLHTLPDGTAIGLALASGAARLKDSPAKSRIMVLVTDGDNNAGQIDPESAAAIAAGLGLKVYAIAVGTEDGPVVIPVPVRNQLHRADGGAARALERAHRRGALAADREAHRRPLLPRHRPRGAAPHLRRHRPARAHALASAPAGPPRGALPAARLGRPGAAAAAIGHHGLRNHRRAMTPTVAEPRLLWLALLGPVAAVLAGWLWRRHISALAGWASRALWHRLLPGYRPARIALHVALVVLALTGVALALARPRWGQGDEEVERKGVDVVLVLDSSLSMSATDVGPDRLTVAKLLTRDLVDRLAGHRLALVQSEGEGEVLAPLTLDRSVIDLLLDSITPASLPTPGTRLARGVSRALDLFPAEQGARRVLVLVSDGEDFGEDLSALQRRLKQAEVVVHTVAVGTAKGSLLPLPGSDGGYKLDEHGEPVVSRVHTAELGRLAADTGGVLVAAERAGASVAPIAAAVARLEARSLGTETVRQQRERFQWFLAPAALALALALAWRPFRAMEIGP